MHELRAGSVSVLTVRVQIGRLLQQIVLKHSDDVCTCMRACVCVCVCICACLRSSRLCAEWNETDFCDVIYILRSLLFSLLSLAWLINRSRDWFQRRFHPESLRSGLKTFVLLHPENKSAISDALPLRSFIWPKQFKQAQMKTAKWTATSFKNADNKQRENGFACAGCLGGGGQRGGWNFSH